MDATTSLALHDGHPPFAPDRARRSAESQLPVAKRRRTTAHQGSLLGCCPRRNAGTPPQTTPKRRISGKTASHEHSLLGGCCPKRDVGAPPQPNSKRRISGKTTTAHQHSSLGRCPKRNIGAPPQPSPKRRISGKRGIARDTRFDVVQPLSLLTDGPLMQVSNFLGHAELAAMDATCRLLLALNSQQGGPWFQAGDRAFYGTEIDMQGGFLSFNGEHEHADSPVHTSTEVSGKSWKNNYAMFHLGTPRFSMPCVVEGHAEIRHAAEIRRVESPDEIVYCRCRLRSDQLERRPDSGVYIEVEVRANADNLSLAVVDFDNPGGCSSVTFSPETGAVLRERKVREAPRVIEGTYVHLLPQSPGRRFEGRMGLYLLNGQLAFYRRWGPSSRAAGDEAHSTWAAWETTGFCTDLRWVQGPRLCMCLAFRDEGAYDVRVSQVSRQPPVTTSQRAQAYQGQWNLLYGDEDHPLAI